MIATTHKRWRPGVAPATSDWSRAAAAPLAAIVLERPG
jgi:hypothetical protein